MMRERQDDLIKGLRQLAQAMRMLGDDESNLDMNVLMKMADRSEGYNGGA